MIEAGDGIAISGDGTIGSPLVIRKSGGDIVLIVQQPSTNLNTGDNQLSFTVPPSLDGAYISGVNATVFNPSSSGDIEVMLRRVRHIGGGSTADVLTSPAVIDATYHSTPEGSGSGGVVNVTYRELQQYDTLIVDVDSAGSGALGLHVVISYTIPEH